MSSCASKQKMKMKQKEAKYKKRFLKAQKNEKPEGGKSERIKREGKQKREEKQKIVKILH